jgi:hypothetical protein
MDSTIYLQKTTIGQHSVFLIGDPNIKQMETMQAGTRKLQPAGRMQTQKRWGKGKNFAFITNFTHERCRSEKAPHVRLTPKTTNFHLTRGTRFFWKFACAVWPAVWNCGDGWTRNSSTNNMQMARQQRRSTFLNSLHNNTVRPKQRAAATACMLG